MPPRAPLRAASAPPSSRPRKSPCASCPQQQTRLFPHCWFPCFCFCVLLFFLFLHGRPDEHTLVAPARAEAGQFRGVPCPPRLLRGRTRAPGVPSHRVSPGGAPPGGRPAQGCEGTSSLPPSPSLPPSLSLLHMSSSFSSSVFFCVCVCVCVCVHVSLPLFGPHVVLSLSFLCLHRAWISQTSPRRKATTLDGPCP